MINILEMIINGELTEEKAYDILDETIEKYHNDELIAEPSTELLLDNYEWTAIAYGVSLSILAKWRQYGWPKNCSVCRKEINHKKGGWIIKEDRLIGLYCHEI